MVTAFPPALRAGILGTISGDELLSSSSDSYADSDLGWEGPEMNGKLSISLAINQSAIEKQIIIKH